MSRTSLSQGFNDEFCYSFWTLALFWTLCQSLGACAETRVEVPSSNSCQANERTTSLSQHLQQRDSRELSTQWHLDWYTVRLWEQGPSPMLLTDADWRVKLPHHVSTTNLALDEEALEPDHGGIYIGSTSLGSEKNDMVFERKIAPDDAVEYEYYRDDLLEYIDLKHLNHQYDSNDDREHIILQDERKYKKRRNCIQNSWVRETHPNCNTFHEYTPSSSSKPLPLDGTTDMMVPIRYFGVGSCCRDSWLYHQANVAASRSDEHPQNHPVGLKRFKLHHRAWMEVQISNNRQEVSIMERLASTSRANKFIKVYGSCMLSSFVEAMNGNIDDVIWQYHNDDGADHNHHPKGILAQSKLDHLPLTELAQNNLTHSERLQLAIWMAESVAILHGNSDGPITHADLHPEQWFIASDGTIRLNDFDTARPPQYDMQQQRYCKTMAVGGEYLSPEEYNHESSVETIDVYAFGNILYSLLTGLQVYYDQEYQRWKRSKLNALVGDGITPHIDDKFRKSSSFITSRLIQAMEGMCWIYDKEQRPDIFQVLEFLRETKRLAVSKNEWNTTSSIFRLEE